MRGELQKHFVGVAQIAGRRQLDVNELFADANLAIELQSAELARTLVILDRSVVVLPAGAKLKPTGYYDVSLVSWVEQGTVVLSTDPADGP